MPDKSLSVYARALWRASELVGGTERLRAVLHVPMPALEQWLRGDNEPPMDAFLKAVDIISQPLRQAKGRDAVQRAELLWRQSQELMLAASRTVAQSHRIILRRAAVGPLATRFLQASLDGAPRAAMLEQALEAALEATHTRLGNIQLRDDAGLRIAAQRGFGEPFLRFFAHVAAADCACGTALRTGQRVVVREVASDPMFVGRPSGAVMESAGARAVQSTPLVAANGQLLGMLSTHYGEPYAPSPSECGAIDLIASRTAFWLERTRATA